MFQDNLGPSLPQRQHYESKYKVKLAGDDHGEQWVRMDQSSNGNSAHTGRSVERLCSSNETREEDELDR